MSIELTEDRPSDQDDWIFSLRQSTQSWIHMRCASLPQNNDRTPWAEEQVDNERASLLSQSHDCWSFSSPFGSVLQSSSLLTITYFPAWQNLPAFTNAACVAACCCCSSASCCCGCGSAAKDFVAETFTEHDIVRVVQDHEVVEIRGIGKCQAVTVYLRPLRGVSAASTSVPDAYREAWETQLQQIQTNRPEVSLTTSPATDDTTSGPVISFCLPLDASTDPPLLWKLELPPQPTIAVETLTVLDGQLQQQQDLTHIFINGYQSWSFTGSIVKGEAQPTSALPDTFSRAFNYGGAPPPAADVVMTNPQQQRRQPTASMYQSDFFTCLTTDPPSEHPTTSLDETGGPAVIAGWLSQKEQFGVLTVDADLQRLQMHASTDGQLCVSTISTDWAYCQLLHPRSYDEEPLVHFLHACAQHNMARPLQNGPILTGWCSWYVFYEAISAKLLRDNVATLASLRKTHVPTNCAVVDDGYMTAWGDWASVKEKHFPGDGMGQVSRDISQHGMRPGLWLAPFSSDKHSQLSKKHPDWVIQNDAGAAANSSHCGKFFHGLDATNPAVRERVAESIRRAVTDWGYSVLKIDFLYAACLEGNGKYDLSMSRAQAMHLALQTIRDAAGSDVFLIGCGCPIGTAIGYVDAMRVSADTGPTWYPAFPLPWWDHGTLPSLRSMIRNSMTRAPMGHRFWHNDPDCLMLGEHTRLTDVEVASAATVVAMTCGMLLLSDDLPKVQPKRMQIVSKIFPLTGVSAVVLDLHATKDGLPSLLRLWCTDRFRLWESFRESMDTVESSDHNAEATYFARHAASQEFSERQRSCIHVTRGLGTWTVVSISNWLDQTTVLHIPAAAMLTKETESDAENGYHVFCFWSSKYSWRPTTLEPLAKKLYAHETEVVHIKAVTPEQPQYIGSDLHFSCGKEVRRFVVNNGHVLNVDLEHSYTRSGFVYVYIPRVHVDRIKVLVGGESVRWDAIGNTPRVGDNGSPRLAGRVIRVPVMVHADGRAGDGEIQIEF